MESAVGNRLAFERRRAGPMRRGAHAAQHLADFPSRLAWAWRASDSCAGADTRCSEGARPRSIGSSVVFPVRADAERTVGLRLREPELATPRPRDSPAVRKWRSGSANSPCRRPSCWPPGPRTRRGYPTDRWRRFGAGGGGQGGEASEANTSHLVVGRDMGSPFRLAARDGGLPIAGPPPAWPFLRQIGAVLRHLLLAAVPAERLFRLRSLDPDRFVWEAVSIWPEAVEAIRAKPVRWRSSIRSWAGPPRTHGIGRLRQFFPSLPLLVYTELAPATAGVLLELGRQGSAGGGAPLRGRAWGTPDRPPGGAGAERVAAGHPGLGPILRELPPELRAALEAHAARARRRADGHRPGRPRPAHPPHLRALVHQGRPALARVVMVLTRLLYAHRLLLDPGYTVEDVALKLGYSKTKTCRCTCAPCSASPRASSGCRCRSMTPSRWSPAATYPPDRRPRHEPAILVVDDEPACAGRSSGRSAPWDATWCPPPTRIWPTSSSTRRTSISCCWICICRRCPATPSTSR